MPARRLVPFVLAALVGGVLVSGPASATGGARASRIPFRVIGRLGGGRGVGAGHPMLSNIAPGRLTRLHRQGTPETARASSPAAVVPHAPTLDGMEGAFNTIGTGANNAYESPSDATGAVGPDFYVAAVNISVAVFDRTASHSEAIGFPMRLKTLFPGLKGIDTDPKVVYDPYNDHFILAYLMFSNTNSEIVIVSIPASTASDQGTWCGLILANGDLIAGNGKQLADYPGLGFTSDRVTVTTNQFEALPNGGFKFDYSQVFSMKSTQLYDPACSTTPGLRVFGGKKTANPDGDKAFTIQPAQTIGGTTPKTQFMASFDFNGSKRASDVVLWRLGEKPSGLTLSKAAFGVGKAAIPPFGQQCGGSITKPDTWWDTADLRLTGSFYDADQGALFTTNAVRHNFGGGNVSAVRWYEVDPAGSLASSTVPRKGFVGADGTYTAWPSVATDSNGDLFVNYSEASLTECLSFSVADVLPGTTTALPTVVHSGDLRYDVGQGIERWGDYSAENRDPNDPTRVAAFNSYALDDGAPPKTALFQEQAALLFES